MLSFRTEKEVLTENVAPEDVRGDWEAAATKNANELTTSVRITVYIKGLTKWWLHNTHEIKLIITLFYYFKLFFIRATKQVKSQSQPEVNSDYLAL